MSYAIGVDLGTTYTAAAVCEPGARARSLKLGDHSDDVPSVLFDRGDDLLFGEKAELRAKSDPTSVVRHAKSRLGTDTPIVAGGREHRPTELLGYSLGWVLAKATQFQGEPPASVTLTHPAHWGQHYLSRLEEAAAIAGVENPGFLAEPEAAGIQYVVSERIGKDELVGVYDLGGGTFDGAILRRTALGFALQGKPTGVDRVGGNVFDDAIFDFVCANFDVAEFEDTAENRSAAYALRDRCRDAKRLLSEDTVADIPLLFPSLNTTIRITRADFESLIHGRIADTTELFSSVVQSAGVTSADLRCVLMVGGSSRIPLVAQLLRASLDCPLAFDVEPKMIVASGAAVSAARDLERLPSLNPVGIGNAPPSPPPGLRPSRDFVVEADADVILVHEPKRSDEEQLLADGIAIVPGPAPAVPTPSSAPTSLPTPAAPSRPERSGAFGLESVSAESSHRPTIQPRSAPTSAPSLDRSVVESVSSESASLGRLALIIGVLVVLVAVVAYIALTG